MEKDEKIHCIHTLQSNHAKWLLVFWADICYGGFQLSQIFNHLLENCHFKMCLIVLHRYHPQVLVAKCRHPKVSLNIARYSSSIYQEHDHALQAVHPTYILHHCHLVATLGTGRTGKKTDGFDCR